MPEAAQGRLTFLGQEIPIRVEDVASDACQPGTMEEVMRKPPRRQPTADPTAAADPTAFTDEEEAEVARVAERLVTTRRYTVADPGSTAWHRAEYLVDQVRRTPPGWFDDPKPGDWSGPEVEVNVAYRPDAEPRAEPRTKPRRLVVDP